MERWQKMAERMNAAPPDDVPLVLATQGPHGPVIYATNRAARIAGIGTGARVTDMRALCPDLHVEYADIAGDIAALDRLVLWARRWCPWTAADGPDGLVLDTTGSDHLFGGEAAMLVDMETRLSLLGLSARLSVAPTWGAAWALARYGGTRRICRPDHLIGQLAPLPVSALRLNPETLLLLRRLGLKTIGALADIPRLSLTRRFARARLPGNPMLRLDQITGHLAEPVSSLDPPPRFQVQSRLAEPIQDPTPHLPNLCNELCDHLSNAGYGCRRLHLVIYRTDGEISRVDAATSAPSRDAGHLLRLFDDKLERINPGFGFDLIMLTAGAVEKIDKVQPALDGGTDEDLHLSRLIDRLSARFGPRSVTRPVLKESHVPERAETRQGALAKVQTLPVHIANPRPIRLLDPPEEVRVLYSVPEGPPAQFIWRRLTHRVARYGGPERIAPEWWRDRPSTRLRDYFRIEDQDGRRFWLYREGLHDDGRGGDPRWFVHGMFS